MKCVEFTCGCIVHPTRGQLRKCGAMHSKSMSGKTDVQPNPELEGKHGKGKVERSYNVGP
jgi:hypothetical protein